MSAALLDPPEDCGLCPRLAAFRNANRQKYPDWFNSPVPVWGDSRAPLAIIGLAPGLQGANRTGRPFTGDYAGDLLFQTLARAERTSGTYQSRSDDGFSLNGVVIINAVRCVPPQNKPIGAEISTCRQFLLPPLEASGAKVMLALGRIAHESVLSGLGERRASYPFGHNVRHELQNGGVLYDSYHCSRYNTNTGRLTETMFEEVVFRAVAEAGSQE